MTFDWWTLALQTINFLVVVWLLSRFLYRPIQRIIQEREAADQKAAIGAQQKLEEAETLRREYQEKLADISKNMREEEAQLHAEMEQERQNMHDAAAAEAESLIAAARSQMATERRLALENLQDQIAGMARSVASQALRDTGDPTDGALQDRVRDYFDGLTADAMSDLRSDFGSDGGGVDVVTAVRLPRDTRKRWQDMLTAHLGDGNVSFETDPEILGGIEFHLPHARLSFSAAERIDHMISAMKE